MFATEITKEYILSVIPEERLFEYYLNVPVIFDRNFPSPFRKEKGPSARFVVGTSGNRNSIRMIDYGKDNFHGDIFALVMRLHHTTFKGAIQRIAQDFGLSEGKAIPYKENTYDDDFLKRQAEKDKQYAKIDIKVRKYETYDLEFWLGFGVTIDQLIKFNVYPCNAVLLNHRPFYWNKEAYPAYAYKLGEGKYKIYSPKNEKMKWLSNNSLMQGYSQLPETGEFLVITKSLKDVMVLDRLGICSVAPPSETSLPPDEIMQELISRFDTVVVLYDFDAAGVITSCNYRRKYGLQPYFLTDGRLGTRDFKAKDLSDLVKAYGIDYVQKLTLKTKEYAERGESIKIRVI